MSIVSDIGADIWASLSTNKTQMSVSERAVINLLDSILQHESATIGMESVMIANNLASSNRNTRYGYAAESVTGLYSIVNGTGWLPPNKASDLFHKAFSEPNIAGVPISASRVSTDRDIEVSESMVIVQSLQAKQYWTDNAVPRLKEWVIDGYITSVSPLDTGLTVKPSLTLQSQYLDICASSRRPVLFKTSRNEFVKVQITNLHTEENAEYNNAIKVTISLKEYNPYYIGDMRDKDLICYKKEGA